MRFRSFFILVVASTPLIFGFYSPEVTLAATKITFSDTSQSPYKKSIEYVAQKKWMNGFEGHIFRPAETLTRAEFSVVLANVSSATTAALKGKKNCFKDVRSQWFAKYVCYVKEKKNVSGLADGRFLPSNRVKISEAYLMSMKAFGMIPRQTLEGEAWYEPSREFMHLNNIFSKYEVLPGDDITREEVSLLVHQLSLIKEGKKTASLTRDFRSEGCGKDPPRRTPTSSTIKGVSRSYITVIPSGYDKNTPMPIVFAFHGRTNSNQMVRGYYRVEQASQGKAIFVYPAGLPAGRGYSWSSPGDTANTLRDFALFDQLLEEFFENYCINEDEVFVVGHSLGAWFTNSLACARGNVIRAIASVGGGRTTGNCTGPVAAFVWHNPKDNLTPFSQGEIARDAFINQNQCSEKSVKTEPKDMNCREYLGCGADAKLIWCPHREDYASWDKSYYPHTWPASAGREIWKFFEGL